MLLLKIFQYYHRNPHNLTEESIIHLVIRSIVGLLKKGFATLSSNQPNQPMNLALDKNRFITVFEKSAILVKP